MPQDSRQSALELKVPPLAVGLFVAALMWLVSWELPVFWFLVPARKALMVGLAAAGGFLSILGVNSFWRVRTTVNPMNPALTSALVVSGVYAVTRNPMYLGFLLLLAGWAISLSNAGAFLLLPFFVFYMNHFQIEPEERALALKFGQQFLAYKSRVRRWL